MNKQALADAISSEVGGSRAQAERVVDMVFDSIKDSMTKGQDVSIAGFGIFASKDQAARTARNPKTGEAVQVPAKKAPKFKAAKALKDAVNA